MPEYPLRLGSVGDDVRTIQIRLNRISQNYPSIPKISQTNGLFSYDTEAAVRQFQEIFSLTPDGVVGKATWYRIQFIYNAVKRLNELNSEGILLEEVTQQFPEVLRPGSTGLGVQELQYYLRYLAQFNTEIPPIAIDGIYGPATEEAVLAFQRLYGLTIDGIVGEETWNTIYNAYLGAIETIPIRYTEGMIVPFPGVPLVLGSQSDDVRLLQEYLNYIAQTYTEIPTVSVTGIYGTQTQEAVMAFQRLFDIPVTGTVLASPGTPSPACTRICT